jgi:hypothetical protein
MNELPTRLRAESFSIILLELEDGGLSIEFGISNSSTYNSYFANLLALVILQGDHTMAPSFFNWPFPLCVTLSPYCSLFQVDTLH